ncbi:MAG: hypothetical protein ACP5PT_06180, partial [Brevinematia bacterium]
MYIENRAFIYLFFISFLCLSFSQLVFVPVLFLLGLFILYFRNILSKISIEDYIFWIFIVASSISAIFAKNRIIAFGGVLLLVIYYISFLVGRGINFDKWIIVNASLISFFILSLFGIFFYLFPDLSVKLKIDNISLLEIPSSKSF